MTAAILDRTWQIEARLDKFHADDEVLLDDGTIGIREGALPYDSIVMPGNLLVNAGIDRLEDLLIGAGGQAYNSTHSRIGVGDDTTAASASQTDLQAAAGSTHRQFKLVGSGPTRSSETITWIATFGTSEANFHWQEWCLDNGTADGTTIVTPMLNRKVTDLGTKTSAASWQFTVTLTIS